MTSDKNEDVRATCPGALTSINAMAPLLCTGFGYRTRHFKTSDLMLIPPSNHPHCFL